MEANERERTFFSAIASTGMTRPACCNTTFFYDFCLRTHFFEDKKGAKPHFFDDKVPNVALKTEAQ